VILSVPAAKRNLRGRDRVEFLSRHARQALSISAEKSGVRLGELVKTEDGAPIPFDGWHWSLSHKADYVAGVLAPKRIGIDIERIRSCSEALYQRIADEREWSLVETKGLKSFYRFWTAKESILKAVGTGIRGLSMCRIERVVDDNNLVISYFGKEWNITHFFFEEHIASIVNNLFFVKWHLLEDSEQAVF